LSEVRSFLDENVPPEVEEQLERFGIDVVSVLKLGLLGGDDLSHLKRAHEMGRVFCSHDTDFIHISQEYLEHSGILWMPHESAVHTIGAWVRQLREIFIEETAESMAGTFRFLSAR
jgi:predicted nuclease of predicted toxin-antitoxin system